MADNDNQSSTSNRGFAAMSKKKQREIASLGGKASGGGNRRNNLNRSNADSNSEQTEQDS